RGVERDLGEPVQARPVWSAGLAADQVDDAVDDVQRVSRVQRRIVEVEHGGVRARSAEDVYRPGDMAGNQWRLADSAEPVHRAGAGAGRAGVLPQLAQDLRPAHDGVA